MLCPKVTGFGRNKMPKWAGSLASLECSGAGFVHDSGEARAAAKKVANIYGLKAQQP